MIEVVAETGSTSADMLARLAGGERLGEGHWLVADRQSAGRGRQGRTWFDGAGNFMGSTLVHHRPGDPPAASLALLAGLAVHDAVSAHLPADAAVQLKWPNDLMVGAAKLAGILLESVGASVVIGIGVNLVVAPRLPDRETIALAAIGICPTRDAFAEALAAAFALELQRWRDFGLAPVIRRWLAAAHPVGTSLEVGEPGEPPLTGAFAGLTEDGALQLRLADGGTRVIHAGEVRFAGR